MATWYPFPSDNGSKKRIYHWLKALCKRFTVTLLAFEFGDDVRPSVQPPVEWNMVAHAVQINPFDYNRQGTIKTFLSPMPTVNRPVPEMVLLVKKVVAGQHFDAVVASDEVMSSYALMLPPKTVKILDLHLVLNHLMWERYKNNRRALQTPRYWLSWKKTNRYEHDLFNQFDQLVTVSEIEKEGCLANLGNILPDIAVIPNGVDITPYGSGPTKKDRSRLIYNGALTYDANYDAIRFFLAEIYPLIRRAKPQTKLFVTGSLEGVDKSGLALDENVTLTGYLDDPRPIIASSAICIIPLINGGGTRLKILESLALGTPVISTSKGVEGLALDHEKHLLVADSPGDFANATNRLLEDDQLQRRLSQAGQSRVEALYDWEKIGAEFNRIIERAIDNRIPTC